MTTVENTAKVQPRLKARYREEIKDALNGEFNYAKCTATLTGSRTALHLRRTDQKRHAVLATRPWPNALLATQRRSGDAAAGEAKN